MSTGTKIIQLALQRIGAHSVVSPASPEALAEGLEYLNSLLELWLSKGIDIGTVPIAALGDEINEPVDARSAIINSLALDLAPSFDNGKAVVSQNLINAAQRDFITVKNLYQQLKIPKKEFSSTLPSGQGNQFRSFGGASISVGGSTSGGTGGVLPIFSGGTDASTESGARISLGLEIGADVQAFDDILADLSGLTQAIATVPYFDTATSAALLAFLDEDDMISDDPLGLASQQSIKNYVDGQVTAADLDFSGDSGSGSIDLDSQVFALSGGNGITSVANLQDITFDLDAVNTVQTSLANLVTVGALNAGSITSGFGSIDIGASALDTTGLGTLGSLRVTGTIADTSGDAGTSGQILSSTGTGTNWITVPGGGDMFIATYDPSGISEQLVGLVATQTLTNKTIDDFSNIVIADGQHVQVRNTSGAGVNKGDVVYISGYNVGQDLPEIALADSDGAGTFPSVGLSVESIANNANGSVCVSGRMDGLDTSALSAGDGFYMTATAGDFGVKPTAADDEVQRLGIILRSHATLGVVTILGAGRTNDIPNQMSDSVLRIHDDGDDSKVAMFQSSGITTATTRTFTFPDKDGVLATIDDVETTARNADTSTALTLALSDEGQTVTMDNASANVVTIPTNASVAFPFSTSSSAVLNVIQIGAGITTITADTGVTLNGVSAGSGAISAQFGGVTLMKVGTNTWIATGAIGEVA